MKQIILILFLGVWCGTAWGQDSIPLSLISTSGGTAALSNSQTIEWTIGEVVIGSGSSGSQNITIGEQQGLPDSYPVGIKEIIFANVKVYPNPAHDYIKIDNLPNGNKAILLTDITGKRLQSFPTANNIVTLSTGNLPTGTYMLIISDGISNQASFKISITNN